MKSHVPEMSMRGRATAMTALPLLPSLVAVIVSQPTATPLTNPVGETVATPWLRPVHVMVRSRRVSPVASVSVATSYTETPGLITSRDGVTTEAATEWHGVGTV